MSQKDENGREHPIDYASRGLNEAEKNYSRYEREGLAIVLALKKFLSLPLMPEVQVVLGPRSIEVCDR